MYGNCFQFNRAGDHESTRAGPLYGLRLLVRVHQEDYMAFSRTAGWLNENVTRNGDIFERCTRFCAHERIGTIRGCLRL